MTRQKNSRSSQTFPMDPHVHQLKPFHMQVLHGEGSVFGGQQTKDSQLPSVFPRMVVLWFKDPSLGDLWPMMEVIMTYLRFWLTVTGLPPQKLAWNLTLLLPKCHTKVLGTCGDPRPRPLWFCIFVYFHLQALHGLTSPSILTAFSLQLWHQCPRLLSHSLKCSYYNPW